MKWPSGLEVWVALEPIDLRQSFDRLSGLVQERLGRDVRSRACYVFFGKRKDRVKVLFAEPTGLCLFYKRLDRGTFRIPESHGDATRVELTEVELAVLLDAIDPTGGKVQKGAIKRTLH